MRSIITLLIICFGLATVHAQSIDSLFALLEKQKTLDVEDANELIRLLDEEEYADSLYRFTSESEQKEMRLRIYSNVAYYYYMKSAFQASVQLTEKAISLAQELRDTLAWSDNLAQQSISYQRLGNLEMAIRTTLDGLYLDSLLQDTLRLSSTYNNLAGLYLTAQRPEDGKQYIDHAIELEHSQAHPEKLSIRYGMAAELYVKLGLLPEALDFACKAYALDMKSGDTLKIARRLSQMGDVYAAMQNLDEAEKVYRKSSELLELLDERTSLAINYKQMGGLHIRKGNLSLAIRYLEKSATIAEEIGNKYLLRLVYEKLYRLYRPDRPALALEYMEKFSQLKDSLYTEKTNRLLSDYQVKYETAKKDATIHRQELQLKEHRYMLTIAACMILFMLLTALVIFFYFTKYRRLVCRERKLNRQKEKMISILSHDIKNPLVTLLAAMRMFDKSVDVSQPALREQSRSMLTAMHRQLQLVDNLLCWAKLQSGQWLCDCIRMDIRPVVDEVEKQLKLSFSLKGCVLVNKLPTQAVIVCADRQMVTIVLRNLLQNAIKYSYRDGHIYLSAKEELTGWCITIRDEGIGITPDIRHQLLMQQSGTTVKGTAGEEGAGIGLSICRELVRLCGGTLTLDRHSEKEGASFNLTLQKGDNNG
jgi:signal transduction histidine kinase